MDQHRLLLLGLLKAQEQHGYQIVDFVERNLASVTTLKKAAAYYELRKMEEQALVAVRTEQDEGRPPRRIYRLTPEGEQAFLQLLRESLREVDPLGPSAHVALMFMDWLPPAEAAALLEERVASLKRHCRTYQEAPAHGPGTSIDLAIKHVASRLTMEIAFFEQLIPHLQARPTEGTHQ